MILLENLWFWQNRLIPKIDRIALDRKVPITEDLLAHEKAYQTIDVTHFLLGIDATDSEAITHAGAGANAIWHTVNATELRWQVDHAITVLDDDQRLSMVCYVFTINVLHVLGHTNLIFIIYELFVRGIRIEVDVCNLVGSLITPVSDDARADDLLLNELLEFFVIPGVFLKLVDLVKAGDGRHEAEECVNSYCDTSFTHENRCFVAFENLKSHSC